jgi:cytochrome c biogenesis protein CcdA
MNAHRRAPIALAAGLAISYATIGTALAWAGTALELDSELVRRMGGALLGLFALVVLSGSLQQRFAAAPDRDRHDFRQRQAGRRHGSGNLPPIWVFFTRILTALQMITDITSRDIQS